jgi:hypothetical protein
LIVSMVSAPLLAALVLPLTQPLHGAGIGSDDGGGSSSGVAKEEEEGLRRRHHHHPPGPTRALEQRVRWDPDALPWLSELQTPAIQSELMAIVSSRSDLLGPNWDPSFISSSGADYWLSLPLLNKGRLQSAGCSVAVETCAALARLSHFLMPRPPAATEVGVRLLSLQPGAKLRPHRGPGGRLVAHLGILTPSRGATLRVAGEVLTWHAGEWTVFDDSFLHSAENLASQPRVILHVTFPHPDLVPWQGPGLPAAATAAAAAAAAAATTTARTHEVRWLPAAEVLSVHAGQFSLSIYANCSAVATHLRTGARSDPANGLIKMYNRVSDSHLSNWDSCVGASLLAPGVVRVDAAHDYGSVDIGVSSAEGSTPSSAGWVTFTLLNISSWHADNLQKHVQFGTLCPMDLCPDGQYPSSAVPSTHGQTTDSGKFQGFRGYQDGDSSGWFTISSEWQFWTTMLFAQPGWKLAYTIAPTEKLSSLEADIRKAEGIPPLSANRALTWQWGEPCFTLALLLSFTYHESYDIQSCETERLLWCGVLMLHRSWRD